MLNTLCFFIILVGIPLIHFLVESSEVEIRFISLIFNLDCWALAGFLGDQNKLLAVPLAMLQRLSEDTILLDFLLLNF